MTQSKHDHNRLISVFGITNTLCLTLSFSIVTIKGPFKINALMLLHYLHPSNLWHIYAIQLMMENQDV